MELWYSPGYILEAADDAVIYCHEHEVKSTSLLSKVIGEARAAAFFALSVAKQLNTETWLQFVDQREQAPDMRVMHFEMVGDRQTMTRINVEVASYTRHSNESLADFMVRTKLNSKAAYSRDTVIVFFIQKALSGEEVRTAHEAIVSVDPQALAVLVGQADQDLFQVQVVYPRLSGRVDTRISEALESQQLKVADVQRGMATEHLVSPTPITTANPFLDFVEPK